jgi:hypothetical protein
MDIAKTVKFLLGAEIEVVVSDEMTRAILVAQRIRSVGGTKMKAVRTVYQDIANLPRESVCFVFHKGAGLTSRGALSYFYRLRR